MTCVYRAPIASLLVFTALTGLSCVVRDYDGQAATAAPFEAANTPSGASTEKPGNQSNGRISITNDEDLLGTRLRIFHQDIQIVPATSRPGSPRLRQGDEPEASAAQPVIRFVSLWSSVAGVAFAGNMPLGDALMSSVGQPDSGQRGTANFRLARTLVLTLVAEVEPPEIDGQALQATSVTIKGKHAYVSYNMRGESYGGAIDVIDISKVDRPRLVSQAIFRDSDINSLTFEGSMVYAAQATNDPDLETPAALEVISARKGKLLLDDNRRVSLPSFAGTSVAVSDDRIYVTSGDAGGLSVYKKKNLEHLGDIELHDARWVDIEGNNIVVVQGTPGQISVLDKKKLAVTDSFTFDGVDISEFKSTVQVIGGRAFVAAGTGGTQVVDLKTGEVLATVPMPIEGGLAPARTVTNAVSADGNLVFISNGEAGVYVARAPNKLHKNESTQPLELELLGRLRFQDLQSVNHVEYKGGVLFVAAGLGGLKIVKVED